jgi:hypothetical protein
MAFRFGKKIDFEAARIFAMKTSMAGTKPRS